MTIFSWILLGLAVLLIADAILAVTFGKPYMGWGLDYTPKVYRDFITRLSTLSQGKILGAGGMCNRACSLLVRTDDCMIAIISIIVRSIAYNFLCQSSGSYRGLVLDCCRSFAQGPPLRSSSCIFF